MKKNNIIILLTLVTLGLASCSYQNNNKIEQKDVKAGSEWVYGVHPDSTARQLKVQYTPNPELEKRTNAIRQKLYGI
ncbi:hypothetical protein GVN16_14435 [Emticicia sp. CRIBPO]|uniref:hypothetical protein n=1 Tax=Emticicia sp. CRIBPO TaxID=2683258 RepID=UPI0014132A1A|nr:hypothetical protein [Emticicia sp. CRIBPO]NBA86967.1 hypothetical protein [Emticicia sp. CRIBPO]